MSANTGNTSPEALASGQFLFLVDGYVTTLSNTGYNSSNSLSLGNNSVSVGGAASFEGNISSPTISSNLIYANIINTSNLSSNNINTNNIVVNNANLNIAYIANLTSNNANLNIAYIANLTSNNISSTNTYSNTINITSNTLVIGTPTIASNGYTYLPNNLKMNWSTVIVNSSVGDVTFSNSFDTTVVSVSVTPISNVLVAENACYIESVNTTVVSIRSATDNTTSNVYVLAIGY